MKYFEEGLYEEIAQRASLVRFSTEYPIEDFDCGVEDYNNFLKNDADHYERLGISTVHLLIAHETGAVLGYIALLADSFVLDKKEKQEMGLDIPFSSVPAIKIGKLAVQKDLKLPYGSFLLWLSLGYAQSLIAQGIACRFLTVDADTEFHPKTPEFYLKNGFVFNEHKTYRGRTAVSMRYDLFE